MNDEVILSWSAYEYEDKERSSDWYWALGVIAITSTITSIIFNNYFFAILILLAGGLLYFFAKKPADLVNYEITEKGVRIKSEFYPYKKLKAFYVQKEHKPMLFIKTERVFLPIIPIPVEYEILDQIHNIFIDKKVTEQEMKEHPAEKIMDALGF